MQDRWIDWWARELSLKVKVSIYQWIYVPTVTYGPELWLMREMDISATLLSLLPPLTCTWINGYRMQDKLMDGKLIPTVLTQDLENKHTASNSEQAKFQFSFFLQQL